MYLYNSSYSETSRILVQEWKMTLSMTFEDISKDILGHFWRPELCTYLVSKLALGNKKMKWKMKKMKIDHFLEKKKRGGEIRGMGHTTTIKGGKCIIILIDNMYDRFKLLKMDYPPIDGHVTHHMIFFS